MGDELHEHLHNAEFLQYIRPQQYNEVVRSLYVVIHRALHDGASTIRIGNDRVSWGSSRRDVGEIPFESLSDGRIHRDNMRVILERDQIAQKHITVSQDDDDVMICHL